jgi:hypothetical protein
VVLGAPYPARDSVLTRSAMASGLGRAPPTTLFEAAPFAPPSLKSLLAYMRDDKAGGLGAGAGAGAGALSKADAAVRVAVVPARDYVPEEDVWCCAVCDDASAWPENALLQCANPACAVVVHQRCYGEAAGRRERGRGGERARAQGCARGAAGGARRLCWRSRGVWRGPLRALTEARLPASPAHARTRAQAERGREVVGKGARGGNRGATGGKR